MDITLGPWTAAKTINEKQRKPLADAMGDEAWNTAKKKDGFTPKQAEGGTPAKTGFTISGQVVQVGKQGSGIQVKLMFTLWADGTFSNIAPVPGQAVAEAAWAPKTPCAPSPKRKSINSSTPSSPAGPPRLADGAGRTTIIDPERG